MVTEFAAVWVRKKKSQGPVCSPSQGSFPRNHLNVGSKILHNKIKPVNDCSPEGVTPLSCQLSHTQKCREGRVWGNRETSCSFQNLPGLIPTR